MTDELAADARTSACAGCWRSQCRESGWSRLSGPRWIRPKEIQRILLVNVKIRDLPGWPPLWTATTGGLRPVEMLAVLRSIEWRVDLRGARDLRITIEYQGHLWLGLYPGAMDVRERLDVLGGEVMLERLHQMLGRYAGETLARVSDRELPWTM